MTQAEVRVLIQAAVTKTLEACSRAEFGHGDSDWSVDTNAIVEQVAALAAPPSAQEGWQKMDTAPTDAAVLVIDPSWGPEPIKAKFYETRWVNLESPSRWFMTPIAWMPLPPPPAGAKL